MQSADCPRISFSTVFSNGCTRPLPATVALMIYPTPVSMKTERSTKPSKAPRSTLFPRRRIDHSGDRDDTAICDGSASNDGTPVPDAHCLLSVNDHPGLRSIAADAPRSCAPTEKHPARFPDPGENRGWGLPDPYGSTPFVHGPTCHRAPRRCG